MRNCHRTPPSFERLRAFLAFGVMLCASTPLLAQATVADPVQELRLILRAPLGNPASRDRSVKVQIQAMESLGDLARALVLREWRDEDQDQRAAAVDRSNRIVLAQRFEQGARDVLRQGNPASQLAVLSMLAEMGTTTHGVGNRHGIARGLGLDVVELTRRGDAVVGPAALRTLGQIDPEPRVALSAFNNQLSAEDSGLRVAAADGLVYWMWSLARLASQAADPDRVEVSPAEFIAAGRAIIPVAARGLGAEELEIRRRSTQTIGYAATVLHHWVLAARSLEAIEDTASVRHRMEELLPLMLALKDETPALTRALADADLEVRARASGALEQLAIPRAILLQYATSQSREKARTTQAAAVRPSSFQPTASLPDDREEVKDTVQAVAAQLEHGDLQSRRAALDTLESLGQEAAPATMEILGALGDADKFVRWAAARTLGRIGQAADESVARRLGQLLTDEDLDVRLAAAASLQCLGPVAKTATADLCRSVAATDAELRLAALRALGAIGCPDVYAAIPEVVVALSDTDGRVRLAAVEVLGRIGPAAREAVPGLCQLLETASPEMQKAAGEALLNILRPGKK